MDSEAYIARAIALEFLWFIAVLTICVLALIHKTTYISNPFRSFTQNNRNISSNLTTYFIHATDVHVNAVRDKEARNLKNLLEFSQRYKTNILIISGDLVDNWGTTNQIFKVHQQYQPDHKLYSKLITEYSEIIPNIIDMPGNHDEFAVLNFNLPSHCFLNYSYFCSHSQNQFNRERFQLFSEKIDNTFFIFFNPYNYPVNKLIYNFLSIPTPKLLDRLEEMLNNNAKEENIVLVTHFPVYNFAKQKNSQGRTFAEIIENSKISLVISGHVHPKQPIFLHHNGILEVIGSDIKTHNSFGLVTIDGNQIVYNSLNFSANRSIFITNPVPYNELSSKSSFNDKNIDVRVLIFGEKDKVFLYSNGINYEMEFVVELKPNVNIYHYNASFENGVNEIAINYQNSHQNLCFYVNDYSPVYKEKILGIEKFYKKVSIIFYLIYLLCFIILFPVNYEKLLFNDSTHHFMYLRNQFTKLHVVYRISFFVMATFYYFPLFMKKYQTKHIEGSCYLLFTILPFLFEFVLFDLKQKIITVFNTLFIVIGFLVSIRFISYSKYNLISSFCLLVLFISHILSK